MTNYNHILIKLLVVYWTILLYGAYTYIASLSSVTSLSMLLHYCYCVGAITGTDEEKFHEQSWFIIIVALIGIILVTFILLMIVCVVRSVRQNRNHEGKYNGKWLGQYYRSDIGYFSCSGRYQRRSYYNRCTQQRCSRRLWEQKKCTFNEVSVQFITCLT